MQTEEDFQPPPIEERVMRVRELVDRGEEVQIAIQTVGISRSAYYKNVARLGLTHKSAEKRPKPKLTSIKPPSIAPRAVPEKRSKAICLIGNPDEIADILRNMKG